jgi:hypothetical protein
MRPDAAATSAYRIAPKDVSANMPAQVRWMAIAGIVAAVVMASGEGARAQFGGIFGGSPPRPPGRLPGEQVEPPPRPIEIPQRPVDPDFDSEDEEVPDLPRGRVLPAPNRPPPSAATPAPGPVQTQPLPPAGSGGAPAAPAPGGNAATAPLQPPPLTGLPPGQRQPRGTLSSTPPAPATLQPGDEIVTEPPAVKITNKSAVFSGLDKITGRVIKFDVEMGETVQFGALRVTPRACYTRPATEAANTDAFIEVDEITLKGEVKRIFTGWMFASSPGLHAVEHPIYDVWLTDCKDPQTTAVAGALPEPPKTPASKAPPPAKKKQQRPAGPGSAPFIPAPFPR